MKLLSILRGVIPLAVVLLVPCLVGCGGKVDKKFQPTARIEKWDNSQWASVLKAVVTPDGLVRHDLLERNEAGVRDNLFRYVGTINTAGPENRPELFPTQDDRIAYYCNAYNALCMYAVVQRNFPSNMKTSGIFFLDSFPVGGKSMNLDTLEKNYLRPFDPRIHFAINCMSASCPPLRNEPYEPKTLSDQLDEQGRRFLSDPRGVVRTGDKVTISAIFKFFPEDFLSAYQKSTGKPARDMLQAIERFAAANSPLQGAKSFDYQEYDWALNRPK